jgi:hypothetical protein
MVRKTVLRSKVTGSVAVSAMILLGWRSRAFACDTLQSRTRSIAASRVVEAARKWRDSI